MILKDAHILFFFGHLGIRSHIPEARRDDNIQVHGRIFSSPVPKISVQRCRSTHVSQCRQEKEATLAYSSPSQN